MSLTRSDNDKIIAGVCGGVAGALGVESLWVRLALVVFVLLGGSGIALYVVLWLFLPRATGGSAFEDIRRDFRRP
ncbi:PspC domain-containing protein [Arachnia propionica]|uniref:PspC domain-containing protein n=1 Tax=Arachnia propionica TaxID=1750 RepID=A0A3P1TBG6_9ACTN|nr:PspC domain-containing protein [Arachnia propionica]MDO5082089.1 PspC domain-containing protein [Arachnia propionica]RRD06638.1 PspC domain-containing protein [Arachnia propionica]